MQYYSFSTPAFDIKHPLQDIGFWLLILHMDHMTGAGTQFVIAIEGAPG
jgi:hypothetical protein